MKYFDKSIDFNEITIIDVEFNYLFEKHQDYYEKQINKINDDFFNDFAKLLIDQYRLKYYVTFNALLKTCVEERNEYDFYNLNFFDVFLDNAKNNIKVSNERDLKVFNSIINISNIFLKEAIDENDFESLLNSFYKLKDKLESNNFILDENSYCTWNRDEKTPVIVGECLITRR